MSPAELEAAAAAGELECGEQEVTWLRMWRNEEDEAGNAVTRAFGFPSVDVAKYVYNQAGNPGTFPDAPTTYRVGLLDDEGEPLPRGFERVGR